MENNLMSPRRFSLSSSLSGSHIIMSLSVWMLCLPLMCLCGLPSFQISMVERRWCGSSTTYSSNPWSCRPLSQGSKDRGCSKKSITVETETPASPPTATSVGQKAIQHCRCCIFVDLLLVASIIKKICNSMLSVRPPLSSCVCVCVCVTSAYIFFWWESY